MIDALGPSFDRRLKAELDRVKPPTPRPENARFSVGPSRYRALGRLKPALAGSIALAVLVVAASAASGSPNPSVWTQRAVKSIESVKMAPPASPTPEQPKPAPAAPGRAPAPATHPQPTESGEHGAEPPEPSGGTRGEPSESRGGSYIDGGERYQSYPNQGAPSQGGSDA